jgi:hypothetical protein
MPMMLTVVHREGEPVKIEIVEVGEVVHSVLVEQGGSAEFELERNQIAAIQADADGDGEAAEEEQA